MSRIILTQDQPEIQHWINASYQQDYVPSQGYDASEDIVLGYGSWCRERYGFRIGLQPVSGGKYALNEIEILDEARWNWFVLTWGTGAE